MAIDQIATASLDLAKLGAGIAIGFGAIGGGLGLGIATKGVLDAIARQPEIKDEAFKNFIIGAGLAEATAIYALLVALLLILLYLVVLDIDYLHWYMNSAPFYLNVIVRSVEFLLPSIILIVIGINLIKRKKIK